MQVKISATLKWNLTLFCGDKFYGDFFPRITEHIDWLASGNIKQNIPHKGMDRQNTFLEYFLKFILILVLFFYYFRSVHYILLHRWILFMSNFLRKIWYEKYSPSPHFVLAIDGLALVAVSGCSAGYTKRRSLFLVWYRKF